MVRSGQVRHCTQQASKYHIGIEFCNAGPTSLERDQKIAANL
jgi:hypothetical protein